MANPAPDPDEKNIKDENKKSAVSPEVCSMSHYLPGSGIRSWGRRSWARGCAGAAEWASWDDDAQPCHLQREREKKERYKA